MLKRALARLTREFGWAVLDTRKWTGGDGLYSLHTPRFLADPRFRSAYARGVQANGGYDPHFEWRIHLALWAATVASRAPGDFVECGVNSGFFSSAILTWLDWAKLGKKFYLIDTFEGPPLDQYSPAEIAAGRVEIAKKALDSGSFATNIDQIRANYREFERVEIVRGAIPAILPAVPRGPVAFLHIDLNCSAPEIAALRHLWDCVSPGGVVLLDDYAYFGHDAQGSALDAAARELGATIAVLPTGQGLIVR
jgi:hypothetical protein